MRRSKTNNFPLPSQPIGIISKYDSKDSKNYLEKLIVKLQKIPRLKIFIEQEAGKFFPRKKYPDLQRSNLDEMSSRARLFLAIGGDGTILRCTRYLLKTDAWKHTPILGVNSGTLGFLTSISAEDALRQIPTFIRNPKKLALETRSCLQIKVFRNKKLFKTYHVLNDCVLSKGSLSRIFEFHVDLNNKLLSSYRSDGLIVSPPTGSTAYNLAAGGAIVQPGISAIQLTPICPQHFSNRPILVSDDNRISLRLGRHSSDVFLTLDGQGGLQVQDNDRIEIRKSEKTVAFYVPAHILKTHYFDSLRQKLNWGLVSDRST